MQLFVYAKATLNILILIAGNTFKLIKVVRDGKRDKFIDKVI